jgi:hypothetical protein
MSVFNARREKPLALALELEMYLQDRSIRVPKECAEGHSLEEVLSKHLIAVESAARTFLLTSVLVLEPGGNRLWHAASPSLPGVSRCN